MNPVNLYHSLKSKWSGKNSESTPIAVIRSQLEEMRPLPMGLAEFTEWSDRIISGACIPGATIQSQRFSLAHMITQVRNDFECDAFFIKTLRKSCIDQIARAVMANIQAEVEARQAPIKKTEEDAKKAGILVDSRDKFAPKAEKENA